MGNPSPLITAEHIRTRPGMYFGGATSHGLSILLHEILTELARLPGGPPERVRCVIGEQGECCVEVSGAPCVVEPEDFDAETYTIPERVNGPTFCLAMMSAVSERMDADVVRDGRRWRQAFAAGRSLGPADISTTTAPPSIRLSFRPDPTLFKREATVDYLVVCGRVREAAAFHPSVRFTVENETDGQRRDFHYPNGLLSLARELEYTWWGHERSNGPEPVWRCKLIDGPDTAEAVFVSRMSGHRTLGGGTHVDGLRAGVAAVGATYAADDESNPFHMRDDPLDGLTVLLAIHLENPEFLNATADVLCGPRAHDIVHRMVVEQLSAEIRRTGSSNSR